MISKQKTTATRGFYPALPFHPKGLSVLSGRSPGSCSLHPLPSRFFKTSGQKGALPTYSGGTAPDFHRLPFSVNRHLISVNYIVEANYSIQSVTCKCRKIFKFTGLLYENRQ